MFLWGRSSTVVHTTTLKNIEKRVVISERLHVSDASDARLGNGNPILGCSCISMDASSSQDT